MSRLTARTETGHAYLVNVKPDEQEVDSPHKNTLQCILDCFERLAAYEDAEEAGLLIRLPCKVGDTVYYADEFEEGISAWTVSHFEVGATTVVVMKDSHGELRMSVDEFGSMLFLAPEEAEAALAGQEDRPCD